MVKGMVYIERGALMGSYGRKEVNQDVENHE